MVSAQGRIFVAGAPKFRKRHHHHIAPIDGGTIRFKILLHGVDPPAHPLEQIGLRSRNRALRGMRIKSIELRAGDNGRSMRQDLRGRFEIRIKTVARRKKRSCRICRVKIIVLKERRGWILENVQCVLELVPQPVDQIAIIFDRMNGLIGCIDRSHVLCAVGAINAQ